MSRRKVWIIGFLIAVPVCLGIYCYFMFENILSGLFVSAVQVVSHDVTPSATALPGKDIAEQGQNVPRGTLPSEDSQIGTQSGIKPGKNGTILQPKNSGEDVASGVQEKIDRPIEKKDLLKAGMVILKKLSWDEIDYLYEMGNKDSRTVEEEKQIRDLLITKLSEEDVQVLRELGAKYGKNLNILDPNVPIR